MTETPAQRIAQLESLVNELTARVAADPANVDLPPLLAAASLVEHAERLTYARGVPEEDFEAAAAFPATTPAATPPA